jgi:hypothetical protein
MISFEGELTRYGFNEPQSTPPPPDVLDICQLVSYLYYKDGAVTTTQISIHQQQLTIENHDAM